MTPEKHSDVRIIVQTAMVVGLLDELSRKRALSEEESALLEKALEQAIDEANAIGPLVT